LHLANRTLYPEVGKYTQIASLWVVKPLYWRGTQTVVWVQSGTCSNLKKKRFEHISTSTSFHTGPQKGLNAGPVHYYGTWMCYYNVMEAKLLTW